MDVATEVVESIGRYFWLLAQYPYLGRARDRDLRPGLRSLAVGEAVERCCQALSTTL